MLKPGLQNGPGSRPATPPNEPTSQEDDGVNQEVPLFLNGRQFPPTKDILSFLHQPALRLSMGRMQIGSPINLKISLSQASLGCSELQTAQERSRCNQLDHDYPVYT